MRKRIPAGKRRPHRSSNSRPSQLLEPLSFPQIEAAVQTCNTGEYEFPCIEAAYRSSGNIALLLEGLRHSAVHGHCPQWMARELYRLIVAEQGAPGRIADWHRHHERDLIAWRRAIAVDEGRRHGLNWDQAWSYGLKSTALSKVDRSSLATIKRDYARVKKIMCEPPGRLLITGFDRDLFTKRFPHTLGTALKSTLLMTAYRESTAPAALRQLVSVLPRAASTAMRIRDLADRVTGGNISRLRAMLRDIKDVQIEGAGRKDDPKRYWRPRK